MTNGTWNRAYVVAFDEEGPSEVWGWNEWVAIPIDDRLDTVVLVYADDHLDAYVTATRALRDRQPWTPTITVRSKLDE